MSVLLNSNEPISLSPHLRAGDAWAGYWLRQVTLRLRREICWIWHERGVLPADRHGALPPFAEPVQAALDLSRFQQEKERFFQTDPTARYLTDLLDAPPPEAGAPRKPGSFGWVVRELDLNDCSAFLLALGLAVPFDSAVGDVIAACLNDPTKTYPTLALAQKLWDAAEHILPLVDPAHRLFRYGLLSSGMHPPHASTNVDWDGPLAVPALVATSLLFSGSPLPEGLTEPRRPADTSTPLTRSDLLLAQRLASITADALRVVPVYGPIGSSHVEVVHTLAEVFDRPFYHCTDAGVLEINGYLPALASVCWLRGADLFIDHDLAAQMADDKQHSWEQRLPAALPIVVYLGVSDRSQIPRLPGTHMVPSIHVPPFTYADRVACWKHALGPRAKGLEPALAEAARRFRYQKKTIVALAEGLKAVPGSMTRDDLFAACRAELMLEFGGLAQKVAPRFHDEHLILPHKQALQFQEIIQAMKSLTRVHYEWGTANAWNEGGLTALFAGPPGTGKTMGAEILARELDLPMYRIDLSQVVNKYIGETEKNLKQVFDAADASDTLLFFDEADSLFGRRTEVKDAHDRYANLEISYLLERMERFKGLAILASNRKKDLDEAFLRRLRFIIDFPLPNEAQRKRIWQQSIPSGVDASEIDFNFLARHFQLVGGHIRSIVFQACLQSAAPPNGTEDPMPKRLTMEPLIMAIKREYDKLNRTVSLGHFGPYAPLAEDMDREHATP